MGKDNVILRAEGLHKSYPMGTTEVKVLKGVDLGVEAGEFVAIVGASGSGKSTLLHILGALDKPDRGSVRFEGRDMAEMFRGLGRDTLLYLVICLLALAGIAAGLLLSKQGNLIPEWAAIVAAVLGALIWRDRRRLAKAGAGPAVLNEFRNRKVGFVFQFYHLLDELSVLENVYLPAMASRSILGWLRFRGRAKERALQLLEEMGLSNRAGHKPHQLSGGERQRVAIARALMNEPEVLLADEPTGNLDSSTGNGILRLLESLHEAGQTILMVTHDERIARRAGRIVTLVDGKIGSPRRKV